MGDTDVKPPETKTESCESTKCEVSKPSIDILKEVKPSENISIEPTNESSLMNLETTLKPSDVTVPVEKNEKVAETPKSEEKPKAEDNKEAPKDELKARNRSDIFSLNENKNLSSTIYSVGGAPSKTISLASNKSSASNDTIKTQTSEFRNPVTGIGVSSNDEFKNKPSKRKDGNPLLGLGYKDDNPAPTGQRIPPGGYSQGLW